MAVRKVALTLIYSNSLLVTPYVPRGPSTALTISIHDTLHPLNPKERMTQAFGPILSKLIRTPPSTGLNVRYSLLTIILRFILLVQESTHISSTHKNHGIHFSESPYKF